MLNAPTQATWFGPTSLSARSGQSKKARCFWAVGSPFNDPDWEEHSDHPDATFNRGRPFPIQPWECSDLEHLTQPNPFVLTSPSHPWLVSLPGGTAPDLCFFPDPSRARAPWQGRGSGLSPPWRPHQRLLTPFFFGCQWFRLQKSWSRRLSSSPFGVGRALCHVRH